MKSTKTRFMVLAAVAAAALFVGAKDGSNDRPANIDANQWVRISDTAGIALTDELAATRQLAGRFYVRTEKGWRVVSILNPAAGQLLNDPAAPRR